MSKLHRITGAVVVSAVAVAAPLITAKAAAASSDKLTITALASPVWTAGKSMPIRVIVHNPSSGLTCDPAVLTVSYSVNGGRTKSITTGAESGTVALAASVTSVSLPAKDMKAGTVKYKVLADQYCGDFGTDDNATSGRYPSAGWAQIHIAG